MPVGQTDDQCLARITAAQTAKETAPDTAKPMFDMLGVWNLYGRPGMPESDSDYAAKTEALIHDWAKNKGLGLSLFLPGHSPLTPAEAPAEASSIIDRGLGLIGVLNTVGIVAEAASLGQMESVIWAITNVINASGVPAICQDLYKTPVEIGVKIPLVQRMNQLYLPNIIDARSLASLRARGMITEEAYNWLMGHHGFSAWHAEALAYAELREPDMQTLLTLLRRGVITQDSFTWLLRRASLDPNVVQHLPSLQWEIPGYADIISIYMREGYLAEKWVEIPSEFIDYMSKLGYDAQWALRLWGKHWVLPGVGLLYDMFHKRIIDYGTMVQMLKYHDFEPVWRQRLLENAYNMIPRVDLRRAYRYRMLSAEGLQERYEWLGFKTSDAQIMSGIALRSSLDRYYTRLESVARAAFRKGKLSEIAFKSILERINTPTEAVSITLEAETIAREADVRELAEEPRVLTASQLLSLYARGITDITSTTRRLLALGYTSEDSALLISLSEPKPEPMEINRDLISAAASLYREGLMAPDEFRGRLRKAGLNEADINAKLEAEELRYRLDYARDLITMLKEGYKKDVYTLEELESTLLAYGMQPERASALVALEELRKLPKPKPTA